MITAPPSPSSPRSPFDRRFVFVTGKGGVGKTSVAAGLALRSSSGGRRTLLATTDAERYQELFPGSTFANDPSRVDEALWTVHLAPDAALAEYGRLLIKPRLARRALFENRYVRGFLRAVPGLRAWAVLGKAWYHATEMEGDRARFDSVIFDAPATGHGLEMLRVPRVITEIAPTSLLRRDAEAAWRLFEDRDESCIVLVTLPEELPTTEAEELAGKIKTELGLPLGCVVANRVQEALFDREERQALARLTGPDARLRAGVRRAIREDVRHRCLQRLQRLPAPLLSLPDLDLEMPPRRMVEVLAHHLDGHRPDQTRPMPR